MLDQLAQPTLTARLERLRHSAGLADRVHDQCHDAVRVRDRDAQRRGDETSADSVRELQTRTPHGRELVLQSMFRLRVAPGIRGHVQQRVADHLGTTASDGAKVTVRHRQNDASVREQQLRLWGALEDALKVGRLLHSNR